jgi:hypothetical protein
MTTQRTRGRNVGKKAGGNRTLLFVLAGVGLVAVVIGVVLLMGKTNTGGEVALLQDGRDHVAETQRVVYTFNPPTSGNHWAQPAQWGFYKTNPPADEKLVHNLEHGAVIVWYNPDKLTEAEYNELFAIYQQMSQDEFRTLLVARPSLDTKVAMTSWGFQLKLDTIDKDALLGFQSRHKLRGPECVDLRCPTM